jgi:hypothetical protein
MATSHILVAGPITWTAFYERNRHNGGGVQRLFEASLATLSIITASHLKKPDKLVETIAGSTYSNMIMVAGEDDGTVNILHHGFVNATSFGGETTILFLSGNSSEAPLKALSHSSAVVPIKTSSGRTRGRGATLDAPTFADMRKVESETEFSELRGNGNIILREKPNHMLIGPAVFNLAEGAQRVRARTLAYQIISRLRDNYDSDDPASESGAGDVDQYRAHTSPTTNPVTRELEGGDHVMELLDRGSGVIAFPTTMTPMTASPEPTWITHLRCSNAPGAEREELMGETNRQQTCGQRNCR